jgi:curved DNA-binding protein CbpA
MGIPDMRTCQADATMNALDTRDIVLDGAIGCDNYKRSMAAEYDPMTDHYVALGVGSMASHDEIKKAHRALIRELHPDRGGDAMPAAQVNIARDVLLNPVTRVEYDRARGEWHKQHLFATIFTKAGTQIHRGRTQVQAGASGSCQQHSTDSAGSSARAEASTSHQHAGQPASATHADEGGTHAQAEQGTSFVHTLYATGLHTRYGCR